MITLATGNNRRLPKLTFKGAEYQIARRELKEITGVRVGQGYVTAPADPRILEIVAQYGQPQVSNEVRTWYKALTALEVEKAKFILQEDYNFHHPKAPQLMPFQRVGAGFIAKYGSTLLCDDCGLGKTAEAVTGVEMATPSRYILVVCLNSLKRWWQAEIERWGAQEHPVTVFNSATREEQLKDFRAGWAIVNYEQLRIEKRFAQITWDWVIFDEAHLKITYQSRKRSTLTFQAIDKLRYRNCLVVTATPMGNGPHDLWPLLYFTDKHRYSSYWRFYGMYVDYTLDFYGGRNILGTKNPRILRRDLASRMLQRTKRQVYSQLPLKVLQVVPLELEASQAEAYRSMAKKHFVELTDGRTLTAVNVVSMMTRLRQILSTPATLGLSDNSCKLDWIMDYLASHTEKAVVFSLYRETVHALARRLSVVGISHALLIGGTTPEETEDIKSRFRSGNVRVVIGTVQFGGTGTNLRDSGATTTIFIDRHYNPVKQEQAEDRIHGIGQTEKVHVYALTCPGTVDDLVQALLEHKLAMRRAVFQETLTNELRRYLGR